MNRLVEKLRWLWNHPETTWSGTGVYVVSLIVTIGVAVASWLFWHEDSSPPAQTNTISIAGDNSGTVVAGGNVTQTNNYSGGYNVSLELFEKYVKDLNVTDVALISFFKIMEKAQVPRADLDAKLREIAGQYKELLARLDSVKSEDPQVVKLKQEAKQAIKAGDYAKAEELLNQAEALDLKAIEQMEKTAKQRRISAAETNADNARLQRVQLRYAKAAEYWQKAAALLPEEEKKDRASYLKAAGYDLHLIAKYKEALPLYEQSLSLYRELGDKAGEGTTLSNIGNIYRAWGNYAPALKYIEQSLSICREIGDKTMEGTMLNSISLIYDARGDYATALKYLEQSLAIRQEIGDRAGEGATLNNISQIYYARGDYGKALKQLEQSLAIRQEIGDKTGEGTTLNNIAALHYARGDYDKALPLYEQSLVIRRKIGDKAGEGTTLSNIGEIYRARGGDYAKALPLYEQSLSISQEIGDKAGEGTTLNNIAALHYARGDYAAALKYLEQSLAIHREVGNRAMEGTTLNNISQIYYARGDYGTALKYLEQSLVIQQEIGDRAGEAVTSWNIGRAYEAQGDLAKAEPYMSQAVQLAEEIGHPALEQFREALADIRAEIKRRQGQGGP